MVAQDLLLAFYAVLAAGALVTTIVSSRAVPVVIAMVDSAAAVLLLIAGAVVLGSGQGVDLRLWGLPGLGPLHLAVDRLSALFLVVAALVFLPVSIFTAGYARRYVGHYRLTGMGIQYHLLLASIATLLCTDSIILFLLAWESMTVSAYLLIAFEHEHAHTRSAAYLYLAMAEFGTVAIVLAFILVSQGAAGLDFAAIRASSGGLGTAVQWAVFLLSFFGFGVKAGLVPLNTWLPRAHPAAPAHVSAILSGTLLNMGLYGILRVNGDLLPVGQVAPGIIVMGIGVLSALVGILYATTENDLKTMLAHSSIENIGIVTVGLGAAFTFRAAGFPALAPLLLIAALYHMGNHSLYKSLLFMASGSVDEAAGTRDLDRLGGLARVMPLTSIGFLAGALSISALPPFNGFVSEWLTLQGLLRSAELSGQGVQIAFIVAGVGLALTAALAVTCFVKAFAMAFLGMPRSSAALHARERKFLTIVSLGIPSLLCLALGVLPTYVVPVVDRAIVPLVSARPGTPELVPPFFAGSADHPQLPSSFVADFRAIGAEVGERLLPGRGLVLLHRGGSDNHVVFAMSPSYALVLLVLLVGVTWIAVRLGTRRRSARRAPRWDGGLRRLLPEMTYTATGFSNPVRVIFRAVFRPRATEDVHETQVPGFRTAIRRSYEEVHVINRVLIEPVVRAAKWISDTLARIHNGRINSYVMYMLLTLAAFLVAAWAASR